MIWLMRLAWRSFFFKRARSAKEKFVKNPIEPLTPNSVENARKNIFFHIVVLTTPQLSLISPSS